jgi:hypothetical protein
MPGVCTTFNAAVLGIAATIYLILGLAFIAASAATFFTPYGKIFTPIYAGSGLGAGVIIFLVSVIGYLAACRRKSCWLGLYMGFDLLIVVLIIIAVVLMFRYEDVLKLATDANLDGTVTGGLAALSSWETNIVEDVVNNAFDACAGNTTVANATEDTFRFTCSDSNFNTLGSVVDTCVAGGVNATNGTIMHSCYNSDNGWAPPVPLYTPPTTADVLAVLQTAKGLYCACAQQVTNDFILKYITTVKYVGIAVAVFFVLIFLSCCYLCCCAPKEEKQLQNNDNNQARVEFTPGGWSAGSNVGYGSNKQKGYGKSGKYGGENAAYIARP